MGVVSVTPRPLYRRGKSLRYRLVRMLVWPLSRSGRGGKEKIITSFFLLGIELRSPIP